MVSCKAAAVGLKCAAFLDLKHECQAELWSCKCTVKSIGVSIEVADLVGRKHAVLSNS